MISVVIPTRESDSLLVPTLAALVPGAADGLVREVLLVQGGVAGDTAAIADAAGCEYLTGPDDIGERLRLGASAARGSWLMFLRPTGLLQEGWTREVRSFIDQAERSGGLERRAATFRLAFDGFGLRPRLRETKASLCQALTGRSCDEQGLLIHRRLYDQIGGYPAGGRSTRQLTARLGRGRLVLLRSHILLPEQRSAEDQMPDKV